jgi:hypothetical protein
MEREYKIRNFAIRIACKIDQGPIYKEDKMLNHSEHNLYIVLSKTNTMLGRAIRKYLGVEYNHCSISLDPSLEQLYSFGRKHVYNFVSAGFVVEGKDHGFFKVYDTADISVLKWPVTEHEWNSVKLTIEKFKANNKDYKYNILGLITCSLEIPFARKNQYFCSHFVADVLDKSGVYHFSKDTRLVKPHEFLGIKSATNTYTGRIGSYLAVQ